MVNIEFQFVYLFSLYIKHLTIILSNEFAEGK